MQHYQIIVIGNGMVGHRFVEHMISHNQSSDNPLSVMVFSEEKHSGL